MMILPYSAVLCGAGADSVPQTGARQEKEYEGNDL